MNRVADNLNLSNFMENSSIDNVSKRFVCSLKAKFWPLSIRRRWEDRIKMHLNPVKQQFMQTIDADITLNCDIPDLLQTIIDKPDKCGNGPLCQKQAEENTCNECLCLCNINRRLRDTGLGYLIPVDDENGVEDLLMILRHFFKLLSDTVICGQDTSHAVTPTRYNIAVLVFYHHSDNVSAGGTGSTVLHMQQRLLIAHINRCFYVIDGHRIDGDKLNRYIRRYVDCVLLLTDSDRDNTETTADEDLRKKLARVAKFRYLPVWRVRGLLSNNKGDEELVNVALANKLKLREEKLFWPRLGTGASNTIGVVEGVLSFLNWRRRLGLALRSCLPVTTLA